MWSLSRHAFKKKENSSSSILDELKTIWRWWRVWCRDEVEEMSLKCCISWSLVSNCYRCKTCLLFFEEPDFLYNNKQNALNVATRRGQHVRQVNKLNVNSRPWHSTSCTNRVELTPSSYPFEKMAETTVGRKGKKSQSGCQSLYYTCNHLYTGATTTVLMSAVHRLCAGIGQSRGIRSGSNLLPCHVYLCGREAQGCLESHVSQWMGQSQRRIS